MAVGVVSKDVAPGENDMLKLPFISKLTLAVSRRFATFRSFIHQNADRRATLFVAIGHASCLSAGALPHYHMKIYVHKAPLAQGAKFVSP